MTPGRPLTPAEGAWLEELVRSIGPCLHAYAQRLCPRAADDLVAETFCRAANGIDNLRCAERPDLYLFVMVRNLIRDRGRRPDWNGAFVGSGKATEQAWLPDRPEPAAAALESETRRLVDQAVAELPRALLEIVVLRFSAGLKFEEIAELLEIPLGTALSRGHSALARLRESLGAVGHESHA